MQAFSSLFMGPKWDSNYHNLKHITLQNKLGVAYNIYSTNFYLDSMDLLETKDKTVVSP